MSSAGRNSPFKGTKARIRLDRLMVQRGLAEDEARAAALIMAGEVYSGERRLDKPGMPMKADAPLEVRPRRGHPWVSRGGLKLEHAIKHFYLDMRGAVAVDIGASTGGFTDVLLHHGAARVYAVDVGYGELAWKIQSDPRVVVMDRTNARHLDSTLIPEPLDAIVCDASFTSLKQVLPPSMALARRGAVLAALIKPQFEARKNEVGEGGIITDPALHARVCADIEGFLAGQPGWHVIGMTESPILGQEGNKEFLIAARYDG